MVLNLVIFVDACRTLLCLIFFLLVVVFVRLIRVAAYAVGSDLFIFTGL